MTTPLAPSENCPLCPRLADFRNDNRRQFPTFFNAPVPSFGPLSARLLVVGLAPGLKGANQTGRPFTGDYAGVVLYPALIRHGFAEGHFAPEQVSAGIGDGLTLRECRITNAVRCVPPQNKPEPSEITTCNPFLSAEMAAMPELRAVVTLGHIAHKAALRALGMKASAVAFAHGAVHRLTYEGRALTLINSYHCSRYNINTRVLTEAMFDSIVAEAAASTK